MTVSYVLIAALFCAAAIQIGAQAPVSVNIGASERIWGLGAFSRRTSESEAPMCLSLILVDDVRTWSRVV